VSSLNRRTRDILRLDDGGRMIVAGRLLGRILRDSPRANYLLEWAYKLIPCFPAYQAGLASTLRERIESWLGIMTMLTVSSIEIILVMILLQISLGFYRRARDQFVHFTDARLRCGD